MVTGRGCFRFQRPSFPVAVDPFVARLFPGEERTLRVFRRAIQERLPDVQALLDLGCGANAELASYRRPEREVWGTDFHKHPALAHPQWFRLLGERGAIPFADARFDMVCASWVLEHVERPVRCLREISRVLKPGGWFIARTISGRHYVTWLSRLLGFAPLGITQRLVRWLYGRAEHDTFRTHYRLNTEEQLARAAAAAGLELVEVRRQANQGYFGFARLLRRAAALADRILDRLQPGMGRVYLVATLRKPVAANAAGKLAG
jgi:ubiquinone/menaquinone biosynthesis C-methylase UbiE